MWPTKDELTKAMITEIAGCKSVNDISDSYFLKHLIIAFREAVWSFISIAEEVYKAQTVRYAEKENLDNLGYDFGVDRNEATKAQHIVKLKKSTPVTVETHVPDDFLLTTTPSAGVEAVKFVVVPGQNKYIAVGDTEVEVLVECTQFGSVGNVEDGAIDLVAQAGFDSVSDSVLHMKAVEKESDESYRERILIRKRTPARAGVLADYVRWAREVPGVSKAKAFRIPRGPGTVDVVIWGDGGGLPDSGLIDSVQKHIDGVTPADIAEGGVRVYAPEQVYLDVIIENAQVTADTESLVKDALNEYFASDKSSEAVTFVDLVVTINKVLDNFTLVSPAQDIILNGRQAVSLGHFEIR